VSGSEAIRNPAITADAAPDESGVGGAWHPDRVIEPRFAWRVAEAVTPSPELLDAAARHGIGSRVAALLARRGVDDAISLDAFFAAPASALHDPLLLPDATIFRDRLAAARAAGERVIVFGDFDADGLTGLAILVRALGRLGIDAIPYVPSRLEEGHGLSLRAIAAATEAGSRLILTVDCGSTSATEIAAANAAGIDVLVTDHHRVPAELPPALAVVNPQRPDSLYPERRLAGSGVAFKLAQLLLADEPRGAAAALDLVDLAAIGSIADLVPLVGETRAIVRLGLEAIAREPRPGIAALLGQVSIAASSVDVESLSFAVAPRINAAGRIGETAIASALLLTDDRAEADRLAAELETANRSRRDLTGQVIAEARVAVEAATGGAIAATIVRGPWPVGIVGLVASRLVDDLGRPAVVGAELGDVIRASCRSDGRLDLGATLELCSALLIRHGGHPRAAGFEIAAEHWPDFVEMFDRHAVEAAPADPRRTLRLDLDVAALDIDYALQRDLARLAPCGMGNEEPLLLVRGLTVTRVRAANGGHSQLTLKRRVDVLDGIAFGRPELAETVHEGDVVDVAARLVSRSFGGYESLQLEIRDVASAAPSAATAGIAGTPEGVPGLSEIATAGGVA
jgi:single-stranded-DNA-specific exonuclease